MSERWARAWFALTALSAFGGVLTSVLVAASSSPTSATHPFPTGTERAFNSFAYFTIDSNVLVGVCCLLLALKLERDSRSFAALRLTSVVAIAVTGLVYHAVLARLLDLQSWAILATQLTHTVTPLVAVLGWLILGPRRRIERAVLWLSLLYPLLWVAFTLIRGAAIHWYPYPFIDVDKLGYWQVAGNCVWVAALMLGLGAAVKGWEARSAQPQAGVSAP